MGINPRSTRPGLIFFKDFVGFATCAATVIISRIAYGQIFPIPLVALAILFTLVRLLLSGHRYWFWTRVIWSENYSPRASSVYSEEDEEEIHAPRALGKKRIEFDPLRDLYRQQVQAEVHPCCFPVSLLYSS